VSAARALRGVRSAARGWQRRPSVPPLPPGPVPWPGADPTQGPALFLDQLGFWDSVLEAEAASGAPDGPRFRAAGCIVQRIPPRGSAAVIGDFLARHHYTAGPGMRGLPYGLYRGEHLLGVAVFSRVCRPRWAAENFALLPSDRRRTPVQRRHLTVTEAEYAVLSRLALSPHDTDGAPLGNGAATWFLSRCLAGLEARNRALWSAYQRVLRGLPLAQEHVRLLREAAGADKGRVKGIATWADPYENNIGRIYQILAFHYTGRTNHGRWAREAVGMRSGRRLSARTLAKARAPSQRGHLHAALRLAWEGGRVLIDVTHGGVLTTHDTGWVRTVPSPDAATEPEIAAAVDAAWSAWRAAHVPGGASVRCRWVRGSGVRWESFPSKHAYFTGLGSSAWYRRQTEIRHRPLTERLLAEEATPRARRSERRRRYYPIAVPPEEIRPALRDSATSTSRGLLHEADLLSKAPMSTEIPARPKAAPAPAA
jgi:hypothetical protein